MSPQAFVEILRAASPTEHPFVDEPNAEACGAAFAPFVHAAADLIEASPAITPEEEGGLAFAVGVVDALAEMLRRMAAAQ